MKSIHALLLLLLVSLLQVSCSSERADIILTNGKIFTADTSQLYVEAIAIRGDSIFAVGTNVEIEKLASGKTKKINLEGRTVVPGFNDAHDHPGIMTPSANEYLPEFSVPGLDKKSVLDSIARILQHAKSGEWITGGIGLKVLFDPFMRKSLDSLCPQNPVQLQVMWGHGTVINSNAMKKLGINDSDPDPLGGWYARDAVTGKLSGALFEYAQWPPWQSLSKENHENVVEGLKIYSDIQLAKGITTVQFMSYDFPESGLDAFLKAALLQRIRIIPFPGSKNGALDLAPWRNINNNPAPDMYVSGVKYILDGTPFEQASMNRKPYSGAGNWYGRLNFPIDTIKQILQTAYNGNEQLLMHIVGDSTMHIVLKLMKELGKDEVWRQKRVRFEHNSTADATDEDIRMISELGIIMAHTPKYNHSSKLKTLMNKGIIVSVSPDGTDNPFLDIVMMTTRQTDPAENISTEQAVIAYTRTNAFAEFTEYKKGTLMPGMLADLAVLSQDIFTISKDKLPATSSIMTFVGGKLIYKHPMLNVKR